MTTVDPKLAAEAWALVARDEDPMPAVVAVDYLRELSGCDDRDAVKLALYAAAAASFEGTYPTNSWEVTPQYAVARWRDGDVRSAAVHMKMARETEEDGHDDSNLWMPWFRRAERALALCLEIADFDLITNLPGDAS